MRGYILGKPKWGKERFIPISSAVMTELHSIYDNSVRIRPSDLVFCYDDGNRLGVTWWRKNFDRAIYNAKTEKILSEEKKYTPHCLRHSINTHLLAAGADPVKVRQYLGWSENARIQVLTPVQSTYTHLKGEHLSDIVTQIDKMFVD